MRRGSRGAARPALPAVPLWAALAAALATLTGQMAPMAPAAPEVREPFFAVLIAIAERDSLGVWSGPELRARIRAMGRRSRLPVERIVRLERRVAAPEESAGRDEARRTRVWCLELDRDLETPMPYSILGYHPGTLLLSREVVCGEWRLGDVNVRLPARGDDPARDFAVSGLLVIEMLRGWLVLDADGFVDRILGPALDDTWTLGFVLARVDGERAGLALGESRRGRPLHGEFDFRADKVAPHGRPGARALSAYCRPYCEAGAGDRPPAWRDPAYLAGRD